MSYRLDSDIAWNYGSVIDLETGREIAPALDVHWKEPEPNFEGFILLILTKIQFELLFHVRFGHASFCSRKN